MLGKDSTPLLVLFEMVEKTYVSSALEMSITYYVFQRSISRIGKREREETKPNRDLSLNQIT